MTSDQVVICLIQQAEADGVRIFPGQSGPEAEGPGEALKEWSQIVAYLRGAFLAAPKPQCLDTLVNWYLHPADGGLDWRRVNPDEPLSEHERILLGQLGGYVWIGDSIFKLGRLEGVAPGLALVSARGNPEPLGCAVSRFRARMRSALPFSSLIVEPGSQPISSQGRGMWEESA